MEAVASLSRVAGRYAAVVLDQWGVLHDGTSPYPGACEAMEALAGALPLAVLSNSGKRATPNRERIARIGLPDRARVVMTSGEALWRDLAFGRLGVHAPHVLADRPGAAADWAVGLPLALSPGLEGADALIVMGLDPERVEDGRRTVAAAARAGLKLICSNPDLASPRAGGGVVPGPGALAREAEAAGAEVIWYGKPHAPVFEATAEALGLAPGDRVLMVGDSPAHDVAGAKAMGWDAALVAGGLHADRLAGRGVGAARALCASLGAPEPDWLIEGLAW